MEDRIDMMASAIHDTKELGSITTQGLMLRRKVIIMMIDSQHKPFST